MSPSVAERQVYRISPWRWVWMWFVFGPIIVFFFVAAWNSKLPGDRSGMLLAGGAFLIALLFVTLLIRFARLDVSETGIRLKQIGYRLEAPWSDVIHLRLQRGHEAFVTSRPVGGKGAGTLAAAAGSPLLFVSLYDAEQHALLTEHRLIPIEAFAWHLRHGNLSAQIERFAPHLHADLAALHAPPAPSSPVKPRQPVHGPHFARWTRAHWTFLAVMLVCISAGVLLSMSPNRIKLPMLESMGAFFQAFFAVQLAVSSRAYFRLGSRWIALIMGLVSVLLALWAFSILYGLARFLGIGASFINGSVAVFFALLTWAAGYGARAAFRRRWWVIGALLVLCAVFLGLCLITTGLEAIPKRH